MAEQWIEDTLDVMFPKDKDPFPGENRSHNNVWMMRICTGLQRLRNEGMLPDSAQRDAQKEFNLLRKRQEILCKSELTGGDEEALKDIEAQTDCFPRVRPKEDQEAMDIIRRAANDLKAGLFLTAKRRDAWERLRRAAKEALDFLQALDPGKKWIDEKSWGERDKILWKLRPELCRALTAVAPEDPSP